MVSFMRQVKQVKVFCRGVAFFFALFFSFGFFAQAAPGDLDTTFGTGCGAGGCVVNTGLQPADAIVRQSDGKLLVGGRVAQAGEKFAWTVIRYNADGTPDNTFGNVPPSPPDNPGFALVNCAPSSDPINCSNLHALAIQSDGKIVLAGGFRTTANDSLEFMLARLNADGTLDTSFGTNGLVKTDFFGLDDELQSIVLVPTSPGDPGHPGQKIIAGGWATVPGTGRAFALARYHTNGSLDTNFGLGGKVTLNFFSGGDVLFALVLQSDGKLVGIGSATDSNRGYFGLARFNANGSIDTSYGTSGKVTTAISSGNDRSDTAFAAALQSDGKIIAAGYSSYIFNPPNSGYYGTWTLARYNTNGTLDNTFGSGGAAVIDFSPIHDREWIKAVAIQASGKIVTAGVISQGVITNPSTIDQWLWAVARFNPNGSLDTTFDYDGKLTTNYNQYREEASAVLIQPDQKIVVAGGFSTDISSGVHAVVRYDGSDTPPPAAPSNLKASAVPTNQINLTWQDNSSNETGFKIERKTGAGGTYSEIATVGANVSSYSDTTGLSASTEYYYRMRAYNAVGNSLYSNEWGTNTSCSGVQEGFETGDFSQFSWMTGGNANWYVSNLNAFPSSPHSGIYFASSGGISGTGQMTYLQVTRTVEAGMICFYRRHWSNGGSFLRFLVDGFLLQAWTGNDVPYTLTSLSIPAGTHTFRWEWLKTGDADPTGVVHIDDIAFPPSGPPPAAPSSLSATAVSSSQINLSWQDNSADETGFKIERKTGTGGTYSQIATVGTDVTTYPNTGLNANTQYCYRVRATNTSGDSAYSNESCTTTLPPPPDAKFRVERATGKVFADGSYNCGLGSPSPVNPPAPPCFNSGIGADLAEGIDVSEAVEPGDLVEPDPTKPKTYRKVREPYSAHVAGVISTRPGMTMAVAPQRPQLEVPQDHTLMLMDLSLTELTSHDPISLAFSAHVRALAEERETSSVFTVSVSELLDQAPALPRLALIGRVLVKVSTENGPIHSGDLLTSSTTPGYAMRCADAQQCEGAIIGKALESLDESIGVILMLIVR